MKRSTTFSITALLALTLAGPAGAGDLFTKCSYGKMKRNQPEAATQMTSSVAGAFTPIALDTVRMLDKATAKSVFVQTVETRSTPTQTVEIFTRLLNCGKEPVQIIVRTHFLDADQLPLEPVSAWRTLVIGPKEFATYLERSTSARGVAHYLVEVRKEQ